MIVLIAPNSLREYWNLFLRRQLGPSLTSLITRPIDILFKLVGKPAPMYVLTSPGQIIPRKILFYKPSTATYTFTRPQKGSENSPYAELGKVLGALRVLEDIKGWTTATEESERMSVSQYAQLKQMEVDIRNRINAEWAGRRD